MLRIQMYCDMSTLSSTPRLAVLMWLRPSFLPHLLNVEATAEGRMMALKGVEWGTTSALSNHHHCHHRHHYHHPLPCPLPIIGASKRWEEGKREVLFSCDDPKPNHLTCCCGGVHRGGWCLLWLGRGSSHSSSLARSVVSTRLWTATR